MNKEIKPGYKETPVGIIPEDWEVKKLGEIGTVINGLTYSPCDISSEGTLVLRSSNVQNRALSFDDNVYVNTNNLKFNSVKKNDILICVRNGSKSLIGKNALITSEVEGEAFGAFMSVYRSEINKYIFQFFGTDEYQRQIEQNLGATINSINNNELRQFKLPIPPLQEQKSIANCLSTWDSGIEKLTQLIQARKQQKKGLMQQLLNGTVRLRAASGERFDEEWKEVRIKDISVKKSSALQANNLIPNSGNYPVYGATGLLTTIGLYDEKVPYIGIVKDGSGVGNMYLLESKSSVLGTLDKIFAKKSNLYFLYCLMKNLNFEKYKVGGAIPHIYYKDYSNEKVLIPSLEEQTAIANILQTADKEIELLEQKLSSFQQQKKGLMQVLLTGEKRLIE